MDVGFQLSSCFGVQKGPCKEKMVPVFTHTLAPKHKKHEILGPVRLTPEKQAPKRVARPDERGHLSPGQYLLQFMKKP